MCLRVPIFIWRRIIIYGEELIVENAEKGIDIACKATGAKVREYTAAPIYMDEHGKAIYQYLCYPVTKEFRDKLYGAVLDTYRKQKDKNQSELAGRMKEQEQRGFQPAKEQETPFR